MISTYGQSEVPDDDAAAIKAGLAYMETEAPVIVTSDFDHTVRKLKGSTTYRSVRASGRVPAKTVRSIAGELIIVISSDAAESTDLERLAAHEAGHVMIKRRGESYGGRHHLASSQGDYNLLASGARALEEDRVERALIGRYGPAIWIRAEHLDEALLQTAEPSPQPVLVPAPAGHRTGTSLNFSCGVVRHGA